MKSQLLVAALGFIVSASGAFASTSALECVSKDSEAPQVTVLPRGESRQDGNGYAVNYDLRVETRSSEQVYELAYRSAGDNRVNSDGQQWLIGVTDFGSIDAYINVDGKSAKVRLGVRHSAEPFYYTCGE